MIDTTTAFKFSYGLFVLTAKDGDKDNGCIINTGAQVTSNPYQISITVNKENYTHDIIKETGEFNLSVLTQDVPFELIQHYGFKSGRDTDKIVGNSLKRSENGIVYLSSFANAYISAKVVEQIDCGTHTLFIARVTQARTLSDMPSVTYQYYFENIKPKKQETKKGYICEICGYFHEGDELPDDFMCPVCKHGADVFKKVG